MKVVHINKKNLDKEIAMAELGREIAKKRAKLEMKRFLRLNAKCEANKKSQVAASEWKPTGAKFNDLLIKTPYAHQSAQRSAAERTDYTAELSATGAGSVRQ